jgi:hypothetical protein
MYKLQINTIGVRKIKKYQNVVCFFSLMHSYDKCEGRIRIEHANEKWHVRHGSVPIGE